MNTFTDPRHIQSVGSLDPADSGSASVSQLNAALLFGQRRMLDFVTESDYQTARDYTSGATAEQLTKQERYKLAEACLALASLPKVLSSSQLAKTGLTNEIELGKTVTRFSSQEEGQKITEKWEREALGFLAPYLSSEKLNADTGDVEAVTSKSGKFFFGAI